MTRIVAGATYVSLMKVLSLALNTLAYLDLISVSEVLPPNRTAVCEKAAMPNLRSVSCRRGMHACGQSHAEVVVLSGELRTMQLAYPLSDEGHHTRSV
jgi:hypothetical protein